MPTTQKSNVIGIQASGALSEGEYVIVKNLTSGGKITDKANSNGEVLINPGDSGLTWNNGDTLSVEVQGRLLGSTSTTISKGGAKVTVTATTAKTAALPAVSL